MQTLLNHLININLQNEYYDIAWQEKLSKKYDEVEQILLNDKTIDNA